MTDNECRELLRLSEDFEYEVKMNFVESVLDKAKSIGVKVLSFMYEGEDNISFKFAGNLRIGGEFTQTLYNWSYIDKMECRNGDVIFVRCHLGLPPQNDIENGEEDVRCYFSFQFFPQRIRNAVEWKIHRKQRREKIYSAWKKKMDVFLESCGCSNVWQLSPRQQTKGFELKKKVEYWR